MSEVSRAGIVGDSMTGDVVLVVVAVFEVVLPVEVVVELVVDGVDVVLVVVGVDVVEVVVLELVVGSATGPVTGLFGLFGSSAKAISIFACLVENMTPATRTEIAKVTLPKVSINPERWLEILPWLSLFRFILLL